MGNLATLRPKPFTTENQPANRGRKKGSVNRSTILNKWLSAKVTTRNPITKKDERVTVEDEVILALIREARKGNVRAIMEIQDTIHGKIVDMQQVEHGGKVAHSIEVVIINGSKRTDNKTKA